MLVDMQCYSRKRCNLQTPLPLCIKIWSFLTINWSSFCMKLGNVAELVEMLPLIAGNFKEAVHFKKEIFLISSYNSEKFLIIRLMPWKSSFSWLYPDVIAYISGKQTPDFRVIYGSVSLLKCYRCFDIITQPINDVFPKIYRNFWPAFFEITAKLLERVRFQNTSTLKVGLRLR